MENIVTNFFEPDFIFLAATIAFAALVHGAVGIGFPLLATPLLSMVTGVRDAVILLVIPTIVINLGNIIKGNAWRQSIFKYWPLALWGIIGSYLGTHLLIYLSDAFFRPLLALMLIFYLYADYSGFHFSWINKFQKTSMAVFGLLAGLSGGMVNVMLPPLIIFALETKMPRDRMIQVFNFCFFTGKVTQGSVLVAGNLFTARILSQSLIFAGLGLIIMLCGMIIRNHIETQTYQKWLKIFLGAVSVLLLLKSALSFFRY